MIYKFTLSIITILIIGTSYCLSQNVVINEMMSSNTSVIKDEDGEYSDWIELYNSSNSEIDISNYGLSDDKDEPGKWKFPQVKMSAKSFLLVFASGKDKIDPGHLHTNFKISSGGESLLLTDANGNLSDLITPISMAADISYGRLPDGSINLTTFVNPSPGYSNNGNINSMVTFSHKSGYYSSAFDLSITSKDTIYYTLNGSVPNKKSKLYKTALHVSDNTSKPNSLSTIKTGYNEYVAPEQNVFKATVVRAVAYKNGQPSSEVFTNSYIVSSNINTKYQNPIISLVTDSLNFFSNDTGIYIPGKSFNPDSPKGSGNYLFSGPEWERDLHIEFFEKDGTLGFSQDAGVRMHGGSVRKFHQKSLRLYAREEYGNKYFNYRLFPQNDLKQYKRFLLRSPMCDWSKTIFKDEMGQDLVRGLNVDIQNGRPVIVLLNGEYWGIHLMTERLDKYYISERFNIPEDSINLLVGSTSIVNEGSNADYLAMIDFLKTNDITKKANYEYIKSQMDVDNFIDYEISEIYMNNYDWPDNNIKYWKSTRAGSKWRWMLYDLDYGFGQYGSGYNMLEHATAAGGTSWPNPDRSTFLLRTLLLNEEFKTQFITRFDALLNSVFTTDNVTKQILKYKNMIANDVPEQVNRWHYPPSLSSWNTYIQNKEIDFATQRPDSIRKFMTKMFGLESPAKITVQINDGSLGNITVNGVACTFVNKVYTGKYFKKLPLIIKALPASGCKFVSWTGIQGGDSVVIYPDKDITINAVFAKETPIKNLYINEFCASNSKTIADEYNQYDDWIELYNGGNEAIDLAGLYITDNYKEKCKWQIPNINKSATTIEAKGFKLLWADEQPEQGPLHVNIKLSAGGEQIGLYQIIGTDTLVVDSLSFGVQTQDVSMGRSPDGSARIIQFTDPTPGATNFYDAINEIASATAFNLLPNPVQNELSIIFKINRPENMSINVYDNTGRLIKTLYEGQPNQGTNVIRWDLSDKNNNRLPEGMYFVRLTGEGLNSAKKIIIIK